jgi:acyl-CoA synthetase (AMP-forming)/AMP-acid ligase II
VVGLPDPVFGEQVAACVELAPDASADSAGLQALCEQNLARFKVPARWEFVASMPRTPLGKIQKFLLQHHLLETAPGTDGAESHASVPGR